MSMPIVVWQLAFFVFPLAFLIVITFWSVQHFRITPDATVANWTYMYGRSFFREAYFRTVLTAAGATVIISAIAFPCAYAIAFKFRENVKYLAIMLLITPFFTSYLVRAYSWQVILADAGVINALVNALGFESVRMLNTTFGMLVGYATLTLPLVTLLQLLGLLFVRRDLVEAAHNLGCGRLKTVFLVVIPSAKIALIIGALFCFILTFGDFVSPLYLGGGQQMMLSTVIIDATKSGQQWPRAAVVATTMIITLIVIAFTAVGLAYRRKS